VLHGRRDEPSNRSDIARDRARAKIGDPAGRLKIPLTVTNISIHQLNDPLFVTK
jgi:hypothetical protein